MSFDGLFTYMKEREQPLRNKCVEYLHSQIERLKPQFTADAVLERHYVDGILKIIEQDAAMTAEELKQFLDLTKPFKIIHKDEAVKAQLAASLTTQTGVKKAFDVSLSISLFVVAPHSTCSRRMRKPFIDWLATTTCWEVC